MLKVVTSCTGHNSLVRAYFYIRGFGVVMGFVQNEKASCGLLEKPTSVDLKAPNVSFCLQISPQKHLN